MARRQKELAGFEREVIAEIDAAAETYVDARDKRQRLLKKEVEAKTALVEVMTRHKRKVYRDLSASPPLVVTLTEGAVNVRVQVDGIPEAAAEEEG